MKKLFAAGVISVFCLLGTSAKAADIPIDIKVNGEYIITDTKPVIKSDITYAPVRSIAEALGADSVDWSPIQKTATINIDSKEIKISIGSNTAYVNAQPTKINGTSFILNDRTYIPVRSVSNLFNAKVWWDSEMYNVELSKSSVSLPEEMIDTTYTNDEIYWLSRIINAESQGEPLKGKIAVGDVILNRVKSNEFPNTIYGVIFDKKYAVQFEPVSNGTIYNTPSKESVAAAKYSLSSDSSVGNCLYFFNPKLATSSWIINNRTYYTTIGGHAFYL